MKYKVNIDGIVNMIASKFEQELDGKQNLKISYFKEKQTEKDDDEEYHFMNRKVCYKEKETLPIYDTYNEENGIDVNLLKFEQELMDYTLLDYEDELTSSSSYSVYPTHSKAKVGSEEGKM